MERVPMADESFNKLLSCLSQESGSQIKRLEIIRYWPGFFRAEQVVRLLFAFHRNCDKVELITMLQDRLCLMRCFEAAEIVRAFTISNDALLALRCVKRALRDADTEEGAASIIAVFPAEVDKIKAMGLIDTCRAYVSDRIAAGGHQLYGACGHLNTQSKPLDVHLYGSIEKQYEKGPGRGKIVLPPSATAGQIPSYYTGHPSYAYNASTTLDQARGYPGARGFPDACNCNNDMTIDSTQLLASKTANGAPTSVGFILDRN